MIISQRPRLAGALLTLLLAAAFLGGCSKGTSVLLVSFLNITLAGNTTGDLDGSANVDWDDELRTPGGVSPIAIGIKSAKLTGGAGVADYVIIDRDVNDPLILRPPTGETNSQIFETNSDDLPTGTYTALELEIVFYEAAITVHDGADPHVRRLRVYFVDGYIEKLPVDNRTVMKGDLLIGSDDFTPPVPGVYDQASDGAAGMTGKEMRWIHRDDGALCADENRATCIIDFPIYQGDPGQFPAAYPLVTKVLDEPIVVDSDTDKNFIVTLEIGIQNLFFFDDAETDTVNPLDFHFPDAVSDDGKIEAACVPIDCSDDDTADFWLGEPEFTATVTTE